MIPILSLFSVSVQVRNLLFFIIVDAFTILLCCFKSIFLFRVCANKMWYKIIKC